jgi:hypothetical protein
MLMLMMLCSSFSDSNTRGVTKTLSCETVHVGKCVPSVCRYVGSHLCKGKCKQKRKRTKKIKGAIAKD